MLRDWKAETLLVCIKWINASGAPALCWQYSYGWELVLCDTDFYLQTEKNWTINANEQSAEAAFSPKTANDLENYKLGGGGGGWKSNKTSDVFKWGLLSLMQRSHWTRKHTSKWPLPVKSVFLASTFKTLAFTPCYTTFHSPFWRSAYRTRVHWIHVKSQSGSQIW